MKIKVLLVSAMFVSMLYAAEGTELKPGATSRFQQVVGTYTGTLFASGYDMPVVTTFYIENERLEGEYVMDEDGTLTPGTLSNITFTGAYTIECTWTDIYGSGLASFTFADDYIGFAGFWNPPDNTSAYNWWGTKEEADEQRADLN